MAKAGVSHVGRGQSVGIVGAGSSGIAALKALRDAGIDAEALERADAIGGNWAYGGLGSACYRSLHANTSRWRMQFADHPMPDDMPAFPPHRRVREYFESYAERFGLYSHIRFGAGVADARLGEGGGWRLTLDDGTLRHYDALAVAHGHYSRPRMPSFRGRFDGVTLHSHDYREPSIFEGKRVVVVGMGNSAMDIACDAATRAAEVHIVARHGVHVVPKMLFGKPYDMLPNHAWIPLPIRRRIFGALVRLATGGPERYGLPRPDHRILSVHPTISADLLNRIEHGDVLVKPGIRELAEDRVEFEDGTETKADVLVCCTGYEPDFPFLEQVLREDRYPRLYRRMFPPQLPSLAFIGLLQPLGPVMPIAEMQGRLFADYLTGRYAVPSRDAMEREIDRDRARHVRRFPADERHALEVDAEDYKRALGREHRRGRVRARRAAAPPLPGEGATRWRTAEDPQSGGGA